MIGKPIACKWLAPSRFQHYSTFQLSVKVQTPSNHNGQSKHKLISKLTNGKLKFTQVNCLKHGKSRVTRLRLILHLIGWKDCWNFPDQLHNEAKQDQCNLVLLSIFNSLFASLIHLFHPSSLLLLVSFWFSWCFSPRANEYFKIKFYQWSILFDAEMTKYHVFRSGSFDTSDHGFVSVDFSFVVIIALAVNGHVVVRWYDCNPILTFY